jgi:LysR family transcriptional activator of nhaA
MDWLNYHHLLYFWVVAREGSIAKASKELRLAQPTISGQIRALEESLGEKLFQRAGRGLVLTDFGRMVYQHANEIFSLGRELLETVKGRPTGRPVRLSVGIADVVPKRVAYRLLEPALRLNEPIRFVCREDKPDPLLADLATHKLDIVIADSTIPTSVKVRAFNHLLGECGVSLLAAPDLARAHRRRFPRSLDGAPVLLPSDESAMRRSLDQWFVARNLRPAVVGEFDDTALAEAFAQAGVGIVAVPDVVEREVCNQYGLRIVGRLEGVRERFYAISVERKLKHPAVVAISAAARDELFPGAP